MYPGSVVLSLNKLHMNKDKNSYVGIDISKDTFDVFSNEAGHSRYENNAEGFRQFGKTLSEKHWCVMEATASYHQQLAMFVYEAGVSVSVVNPMVIRRFMQMKLRQTKTDKGDAKMIAQYASEQPLKRWQPEPEYVSQCKMLHTTVGMYFKQSTALKNKLHSLESQGVKTGALVRSLNRQVKQLQKEIAALEKEMEGLIKTHEPQLLTNITSIPGVGKKTAMLLIAGTNGFKQFESHRQVSAYFGLAPTERSSGSSVRGRSRISKRGHPKVRNHLFLCSFTACECNPQCRVLYERLVAKGKSKKLALIAVCNKLIKQAYAIAKSGLVYDPHYRSMKPQPSLN